MVSILKSDIWKITKCDIWKITKICPNFKSGDKYNIIKYRSISVLSNFVKYLSLYSIVTFTILFKNLVSQRQVDTGFQKAFDETDRHLLLSK